LNRRSQFFGIPGWLPFGILSVVLLVGCQPEVASEATAFANRYAVLHQERNLDGLEELVAWGDAPEAVRTHFRRAMAEETRWPIRTIRIEEATQRDIRDHFGREEPPPGPLYRLEIRLDTADGFGSVWIVGEPREGDGLYLLLQPGH